MSGPPSLVAGEEIWGRLGTVGGTAEHIPGLVGRCVAKRKKRDWEELYNQVCHQQTVHGAAYAAVVLLVSELATLDATGLFWTLSIAGTIEAHGARAAPDEGLERVYREQLSVLRRSAVDAACRHRWDQLEARTVAASIAAIFGQGPLAIAVERTSFGEAEVHCPECGEYLLVAFTPEGLRPMRVDSRCKPLHGDDRRPAQGDRTAHLERTRRIGAIEAALRGGDALAALAVLVQRLEDPVGAQHILDLDTELECPSCSTPFALLEALREA